MSKSETQTQAHTKTQTAQQHNFDAERSVLGAMFLDDEAVDIAFEQLSADDFYLEAHREIFRAAKISRVDKKALDLVLICEKLKQRDTLLAVGGIPYITDMSRYTPSAANVTSYIAIVREKAALRRLAAAGQALVKAAYEGEQDAQDIIARVDAALKNVSDRFLAKARDNSMKSAMLKAITEIERRMSGQTAGMPIGITSFDRGIGGLFPGEYTVIGARPSVGKSALALHIAVEFAFAGRSVIIFSQEMTDAQIGERLIAKLAYINSQKLRLGTINAEEHARMRDVANTADQWPVHIMDPVKNVSEIRAECRNQAKTPEGLGIIIVDYLQLLKGDNRGENRQQEVTEISGAMKSLTKEFGCPVVALSQLNRQSARRDGNLRPNLSDLRESGSIEQDADNVILIHEPTEGDGDFDQLRHDLAKAEGARIVQLIIAKQRQGITGDLETLFFPAYYRFASVGDIS